MPFRRRFKRAGTRKRAIWLNVPFGSTSFSESVGNQLLLTPEDWEAQFAGNANELAVLRAVVGMLTIQPTTAGTQGTTGFWGIYISDKDATVVPTFTVANMGDVDWLTTGAFGTAGALVSATAAAPFNSIPIRIKAKRKLKSRDAIYICAQYGSDAAAPVANLGGLLRFLVARD